nr:MAG TPA: hypothetical protein [Bacteriophage sp.]
MLQKSENSTDFTPSPKEPSKEPKNHQNGCISSFESKISPVTIKYSRRETGPWPTRVVLFVHYITKVWKNQSHK